MQTLIKVKEVALLITDKVNFRMKKTIRGRERYYLMILKGSVHKKDIVI